MENNLNWKELKKATSDAKKRFSNYTSFENLLFICELLELESEKYETEKQEKIALDIRKLELELSKLLEEVF